MITKIAKEFKWEMSHRLTFHDGLCKNIHGHSYKVRVELTGELDENSMVLDYYDLHQIISPITEKLDHSFLCDKDDDLMLNFLKENNFRYVVMEKHTTAENMLEYFFDNTTDKFKKYDNIHKLKIRIYETEDVYAERQIELR
jgi:6-pyruvoyltetrahydropterin/6-carboxytetrahydropterin synthase